MTGGGTGPVSELERGRAMKTMARRALERAAERAPLTGAKPQLIIDEPTLDDVMAPRPPCPRDPFAAIEVLEEALETIVPTASFRWEVQGAQMVLIADLGSSLLEVSPLAGDRLRVTARPRPPEGSSEPRDDHAWDPME